MEEILRELHAFNKTQLESLSDFAKPPLGAHLDLALMRSIQAFAHKVSATFRALPGGEKSQTNEAMRMQAVRKALYRYLLSPLHTVELDRDDAEKMRLIAQIYALEASPQEKTDLRQLHYILNELAARSLACRLPPLEVLYATLTVPTVLLNENSVTRQAREKAMHSAHALGRLINAVRLGDLTLHGLPPDNAYALGEYFLHGGGLRFDISALTDSEKQSFWDYLFKKVTLEPLSSPRAGKKSRAMAFALAIGGYGNEILTADGTIKPVAADGAHGYVIVERYDDRLSIRLAPALPVARQRQNGNIFSAFGQLTVDDPRLAEQQKARGQCPLGLPGATDWACVTLSARQLQKLVSPRHTLDAADVFAPHPQAITVPAEQHAERLQLMRRWQHTRQRLQRADKTLAWGVWGGAGLAIVGLAACFIPIPAVEFLGFIALSVGLVACIVTSANQFGRAEQTSMEQAPAYRETRVDNPPLPRRPDGISPYRDLLHTLQQSAKTDEMNITT